MGTDTQLDQLAINTLRFLSVDQVEEANSGHPGLPLGAAPMAYTVFRKHLRFDPMQPDWFNRDRFVLSAGHGSALLYSLLFVFGYDLSLDDLKGFRQLHSITPGHPEFGLTPGVEATTGPLGQGLGMAVGMAVAERWMNARYGAIIDHRVFCLVSDGDLMEGIGSEAASLAGHLGLGRLICLYDDNGICLDGDTSHSFTEDVGLRFQSYNWQVLSVEDGNDIEAIDKAITEGLADETRPTLIKVKTQIGFGSPKAGTSSVHGSPLGKANTESTKKALGWPTDTKFYVPAEVAALAMDHREDGERTSSAWEKRFEAFEDTDPDLAAEITAIAGGELPTDWDADLLALSFPDKEIASRDSGKTVLNAIASRVPWLVGGSADLSSSTKTTIDGSGIFGKTDRSGRNVWFGVREHAMGAIVNGMALSGLRSFGSTFLVFSDYMRGALRLSSLMEQPSTWIFTHDSVFVGEDGPTHQPIEHVMSLRLIPGMKVYRPCDANETAAVYHTIMERGEPACVILTRQGLPTLNSKKAEIWAGVPKGAYVIHEPEGEVVGCIIATGSEVTSALEAAEILAKEGHSVRVVSMPCMELFQALEFEETVEIVNPELPTVTIEAGRSIGWEAFSLPFGVSLGIDTFGQSAPGSTVYRTLGMDAASLAAYMSMVLQPDEEVVEE